MTGALCALAAPYAPTIVGGGGGGGQMTVTASPDTVLKTKGTRASSLTISSTTPCVVSVTGGITPFSYAWTKVRGDTITATNPTAASTYFSGVVSADTTLQAAFICTVTDALGATAPSNEVSVSLSAVSFTTGSLA